ncbi:MAG TPA: hypothetical protein PK402_06555, partial [Tepidisphaeraceae bacterium]|nr:hypothetical protein [Tepidisphaeraceae bacterium]
EAEALLKYKHPDHFNTLGSGLWRGRIYGADIGIRFGRDVIYHGVFGTGLFQTIYRRPASMLAMMLMSVEWHLLTFFVGVCGIAWRPLIWVAFAMILLSVLLAITAALQAKLPGKPRHILVRPLIAWLHWRQPIVRGLARYTVRLRAKGMRDAADDYAHQQLPINRENPNELMFWSKHFERVKLLETIKDEVDHAGLRYRIDAGWHDWDLEIYGSRYVKVRVKTVSEKHQEGLMTRVHVTHHMSTFCKTLLAAGALLSIFLLVTVWPFSRPALLIPLVWYTLFIINRHRVARPILGLISTAAEKAGFYHGTPKKK